MCLSARSVTLTPSITESVDKTDNKKSRRSRQQLTAVFHLVLVYCASAAAPARLPMPMAVVAFVEASLMSRPTPPKMCAHAASNCGGRTTLVNARAAYLCAA